MGAGVAGDEVAQRGVDRLGAHGRQADRDGDAERVAQPTGVLGRAHALLAADATEEGAPLRDQLLDPRLHRRTVDGAQAELVERERAEETQQVVHLVDVAGQPTLDQALQLQLEVGQHVGVDELAQLLGAEQVAQQVAVEREGGGPALGQRRVALVHVHGDPAEQQRLRERRGALACRRRRRGSCGCGGRAAPRSARARRTRRSGTRGWPRAGSGTPGTCPPPRAGRPPAVAAATAACAGRADAGAGAAPARRTRGSGWRTSPWRAAG